VWGAVEGEGGGALEGEGGGAMEGEGGGPWRVRVGCQDFTYERRAHVTCQHMQHGGGGGLWAGGGGHGHAPVQHH
jgi:hypothetical protein